MKGVPWQPRGEPTSILKPDAKADRAPRSVYITLDRQIKYGQTPGCPGCFSSLDDPKRHTAECKKRFGELLKKDKASDESKEPLEDAEMERTDAPEVPDLEAGGSAPTSGSAGSTAGQAGSPAGQVDPAGSTADSSRAKRPPPGPESEPKKEKKTPKQGEKRPAEVSPDDLAEQQEPESEMIGGLPTLHWSEWTPIAAYPD